jgi:hypothetical protein
MYFIYKDMYFKNKNTNNKHCNDIQQTSYKNNNESDSFLAKKDFCCLQFIYRFCIS